MFETLLRTEAARRRYREGPFAAERERYLQHRADLGATRASLKFMNRELLWVARLLEPDAANGVDMAQLQKLVRRRALVHRGATTAVRTIVMARPWLRFLGWWRTLDVVLPFQDLLDCYVAWMRDERGFSASTVEMWRHQIGRFLQWCATANRHLGDLQPSDIDRYFVEGAQHWSRVTVSGIASALRVFLRYAAAQGRCDAHLADTIQAPRVYQQESLPFAPDWSDVRRLLDTTATDRPYSVFGVRVKTLSNFPLRLGFHDSSVQLVLMPAR